MPRFEPQSFPSRESFDAIYKRYRPFITSIASDNGGPWYPVFLPKGQWKAYRVKRMWERAFRP